MLEVVVNCTGEGGYGEMHRLGGQFSGVDVLGAAKWVPSQCSGSSVVPVVLVAPVV